MTKPELIRIFRLVDLYKLKYLNLNFKKLLLEDVNYVKIKLEVAKKFIDDEISERQEKAIKLAKKHLKENPKTIYLKYYSKKYEPSRM